jgi:hypothetical protein
MHHGGDQGTMTLNRREFIASKKAKASPDGEAF